MITKMNKYSFILLSGEAGDFLKRLQELGVVDITRSKKPVDRESSEMLDQAMEMKKVISLLGKTDYGKDADAEAIKSAMEHVKVPQDMVSCVLETAAEADRLKLQFEAARKEMAERKPWGDFDKDALDGLAQHGFKVRWYRTAAKKFRKEWAEECALQIVEEDGNHVWFVTVSGAEEDGKRTKNPRFPSSLV